MTEDILRITGLIVTAIGSLGTFIYVICDLRVRVNKLWKDNETMIDFHVRRSWSEAFQKNIATINSPTEISAEAKAWMNPIVDDVKLFYARLGRHLNERDLWLEIERKFGDRMLKEVCIPHGLSQGACIIIAMEAVK